MRLRASYGQALVALVVLTASAAGAWAADGPEALPLWVGHFRWVPAHSDDPGAAAERLVAEAPRLWSPALLARLKLKVAPPAQLHLALDGPSLRVEATGRPPLALRLGAPAQAMAAAAGPREAKAWRDGAALWLRMGSPSGSETWRFLGEANSLQVDHSLALPAARRTLRIASLYHRF